MMTTTASALPATRCHAIVLAAGRGKRFDPSGQQFKLNQQLKDGVSVIQRTVESVAQVCSEFHIIARDTSNFDAQFFLQYGANLRVCPQADLGMGHSLAFGVAQLSQACEAVLVVLADMPWLQVSTLRLLRDQILRDLDEGGPTILVPTYQAQRGHPVGFARRHFAELMKLEGDQGARALLKTYAVREMPVDDVGVLRDLDTPADLA